MSALPEASHEHDNCRDMIRYLEDQVAQLRAPVRLVQMLLTGAHGSLYALDDQGRLWLRYLGATTAHWERLPGPNTSDLALQGRKRSEHEEESRGVSPGHS